jgi:drug/metabolite transporter (DMT)-like permease
MIGVVILNVLLAFGLILRKNVLIYAEPIFFQGSRLTVAGLAILGYLYFFNRNNMRLRKKDIGLFFLATIFFSYISYVFAVLTLDDISSARFTFAYNMTPFITAICAFFLLGEKLTSKQVISLLLGFIGFLPLVFASSEPELGNANFLSVAGFQLLIAVIAYSYGWVVVSQLVNDRKYSPLLVTGVSFLSGGIAALFTSLALESHNDIPVISDWFNYLIYLASIIFISEIVCYNLYAFLLKKYSATFLSFAGFLYTIFGALFGWFFLQERITYNFVIATIVVTAALYLYYQAEQEKKLLARGAE